MQRFRKIDARFRKSGLPFVDCCELPFHQVLGFAVLVRQRSFQNVPGYRVSISVVEYDRFIVERSPGAFRDRSVAQNRFVGVFIRVECHSPYVKASGYRSAIHRGVLSRFLPYVWTTKD